VYQKNTKRM